MGWGRTNWKSGAAFAIGMTIASAETCWATTDLHLDGIFVGPVSAKVVHDERLQDQRGKFVGTSGAETFFGVTLTSHIEDPLGHVIDISLGMSALVENDTLHHTFERDIRYSRRDGSGTKTRRDHTDPTPVTPAGLDTATGFVQSIIVGGGGNDVHQRADVTITDQIPSIVIDNNAPTTDLGHVTMEPSNGVTIDSVIETGSIGFDVTLHGIGTVKQSIRNGHVGQHVSLAHDGVVVRQNLEIMTGPLPSLEQRGSRTMMELMRGLR